MVSVFSYDSDHRKVWKS